MNDINYLVNANLCTKRGASICNYTLVNSIIELKYLKTVMSPYGIAEEEISRLSFDRYGRLINEEFIYNEQVVHRIKYEYSDIKIKSPFTNHMYEKEHICLLHKTSIMATRIAHSYYIFIYNMTNNSTFTHEVSKDIIDNLVIEDERSNKQANFHNTIDITVYNNDEQVLYFRSYLDIASVNTNITLGYDKTILKQEHLSPNNEFKIIYPSISEHQVYVGLTYNNKNIIQEYDSNGKKSIPRWQYCVREMAYGAEYISEAVISYRTKLNGRSYPSNIVESYKIEVIK